MAEHIGKIITFGLIIMAAVAAFAVLTSNHLYVG